MALIFKPIKGQTFASARARLEPIHNFHLKIVTPIGLLLLTIIFTLTFKGRGEDPLFILFFMLTWLFIMAWNSWFFWRTRDVIYIVNDPYIHLPGLLRGNGLRDPFQLRAERVPDYLKCQQCGDPLISQRWMKWYFFETCRQCGWKAEK